MMLNSTYPSSSSLKRSISTPGTLFTLKSLDNDTLVYERNGSTKYSTNSTLSRSWLFNKIPPDVLAKQLTLIDWEIFCRITRKELKPGQWTGPKKHILSPNVVAFTRRFNVLTFWISDEILSLKLPKQRAEVISYFIRVCNYLVELKSLNSAYAIFCALNLQHIHRLEKSWACLSKKDRQCFDKIAELFSHDENHLKFRKYFENILKQPHANCIPNLSTFQHDIIHIDSYYLHEKDPARLKECDDKLNSIYSTIERCQQSNYDFIELVEDVYDYLNSLNFIEELQKFREDDYHKISLKLEPELIPTEVKPSCKPKLFETRFNSQYDLPSSQFYLTDSDSNSTNTLKLPANNLLNKSLNEELLHKNKEPFKPGHRKTNSLEANAAYAVQPSNKNNHSLMQSTNGNKVAFGGSTTGSTNCNKNVNLIDDTLNFDFYTLNGYLEPYNHKPTLEVEKSRINPISRVGYNGVDRINFVYNDGDGSSLEDTLEVSINKQQCSFSGTLIHKGMVSRKTVIKVGKKPPIPMWSNYILVLSSDALMFFSTKSVGQQKGSTAKPLKTLPLLEWSARFIEDESSNYLVSQQKRNTFTLVDHTCSTVYRVRTATESEAREWVYLIHKETLNLKNSNYHW